jgi:Na+/melibiose symporter-like transporter
LGSYVAFQFILTLYVQNSLGWSPIQMALSFAPSGVMAFFVAPRVGAIEPRFGTERLLLVGLTVAFVGYLLLLRVSPSMPYMEFLFPTIISTGAAFAIVFPAVNIQATAGIANTEQGVASGIVNTSMQLGGALLLAVAAAVLGTSSVAAQHRQLLPHMDAALSVPAVATGLALAVTAARLVFVRRSTQRGAGPTPPGRSADSPDAKSGPDPRDNPSERRGV